jgi:hypothetical protein
MSNSTNKIIRTKSDGILLEDVGEIAVDEVVDAIATSIPGINIPYKLAKAYFGRGMKLRQQRVLEWVEFVRDNLGQFSQQLFSQVEFQDCFVLLLEAYIKERAKKKRQIYQRVLLQSTNKGRQELERFELEKMILVTTQISYEALNVLDFVSTNLLSMVEKDIQEQLKVFKDRQGVEGSRLEDITRDRIIISDYINKWIHERYGMNSDLAKKRYGYTNESSIELQHQISYEEHLKQKELMGPLVELSNLGILIKREGHQVFGGPVGSGFSISEFGYKYMSYLDNPDK